MFYFMTYFCRLSLTIVSSVNRPSLHPSPSWPPPPPTLSECPVSGENAFFGGWGVKLRPIPRPSFPSRCFGQWRNQSPQTPCEVELLRVTKKIKKYKICCNQMCSFKLRMHHETDFGRGYARTPLRSMQTQCYARTPLRSMQTQFSLLHIGFYVSQKLKKNT